MVVQENQNCSIGNSFGVATNGQKLKRRGSIRAPAFLTKGIIMKNLACATGLVVLCLLKATLVWSIWCCVVGALALIGAIRVFWVWRNLGGGAG